MLLCVHRATQIKTYSWDNAQVIMVGNKCDMDEERVVPPEKGKHLADQLGETQFSLISGATDSRRHFKDIKSSSSLVLEKNCSRFLREDLFLHSLLTSGQRN